MAAGTSTPSAVGNAPMRSRARAPCAAALELVFGELEALGDGVCVLEQDLALAGEPQAAGRALQQPSADLALQRGHLVRDRWLGQRELTRGTLRTSARAPPPGR